MEETWKRHVRNMEGTWKGHGRDMEGTWTEHGRILVFPTDFLCEIIHGYVFGVKESNGDS